MVMRRLGGKKKGDGNKKRDAEKKIGGMKRRGGKALRGEDLMRLVVQKKNLAAVQKNEGGMMNNAGLIGRGRRRNWPARGRYWSNREESLQ